MRSTVSRKSVILLTLFLVVLASLGTIGGYFFGRSSERGGVLSSSIYLQRMLNLAIV